MSLADYLAKNYLTADPGPPKKKRKKNKATSSAPGLTITSDDYDLRTVSINTADSDDDGPLIASGKGTADFRKSNKSNWQVIGTAPPTDADQAQADAILAAAAAEDRLRRADNDADHEPTVLDGEGDGMRMESGARAGLQTAAQTEAMIKAQLDKRRNDEDMGLSPGHGTGGVKGKEETIYRDASGRIINVAMKRAEARKKADEDKAKTEAAKEAQKGDVQRRQQEERKQKLHDAKYMTLSRYADDEEMNDELREKERWNDPAAMFLTKKKQRKGKSGMPLYMGPAAPNRYGIRPGHRWDGVDRGNGFEKEWFLARNRLQRKGDLEYAWQMDE